ncbi:hypothetical protein HacjB3_01280 [Halalkalicoccus jeotgali B3]|uniref:Uncharacterized protein n=1 Tax=Halalkalicoccus jeotgali (strain DSM 18796 / CECT 7217 / JCM 14584 / KCTC 4019 / B3) TaxID=795797 RepID=D8J568_HALJB|nr:hypothetical protein HacjB3_01280 [Halalkalicoccus jeotgali B3]
MRRSWGALGGEDLAGVDPAGGQSSAEIGVPSAAVGAGLSPSAKGYHDPFASSIHGSS